MINVLINSLKSLVFGIPAAKLRVETNISAGTKPKTGAGLFGNAERLMTGLLCQTRGIMKGQG